MEMFAQFGHKPSLLRPACLPAQLSLHNGFASSLSLFVLLFNQFTIKRALGKGNNHEKNSQ